MEPAVIVALTGLVLTIIGAMSIWVWKIGSALAEARQASLKEISELRTEVYEHFVRTSEIQSLVKGVDRMNRRFDEVLMLWGGGSHGS